MCSILLSSIFLNANDNITIMTENYPLYNMKSNGKLKGISVDIAVEILKDIKSNHMVFSTTRTKQRFKCKYRSSRVK